MGTTNIQISHVRSRSPSVASEGDPHDTGARVSARISPQYSTLGSLRGGHSQSGSSEPREEIAHLHLHYPDEPPEPELHPSDSASRLAETRPTPLETSRSSSLRREPVPRRRAESRDPGRPPAQEHPRTSPTESIGSFVSSAEDFLSRQQHHQSMPRPQSYYSHSSDSYGHPMGPPPPGNQIIHYAAPPPQPVPYGAHYSHMPPPSHPGYAPSVHSYPPLMIHQAPSHASSPYTNSPFMSPMPPYGPPGPGYFSSQYPQPYPPYPPHPPHPPHMDWRVQSPSQSIAPAPAPVAAAPAEAPKSTDTDELAKKIEALLLEQKSQALKNEADREGIIKAAREEAQAQAERLAHEQRIRDEATIAALKQAADAAAAEREKAAAEAKREKQIREEAAAAARQALADEAQAKAERAAADKKIAEDAANEAREKAEGKAAEAKKAADEKQEEAEKKLKEAEKAAEEAKAEAEKKLKEAEKAAEEAKAEAEKAAKEAAANAPAEKKAPIMFHDAYNRSYKLPFEICEKWRSMEHLIQQAHQGFDAAELVSQRRYDLLGPSGDVIMPHVWEAIIEPGWDITLKPWPEPEPPPPPPPEPVLSTLDDSILTLDDILNPPKKDKSKGGGSRKKTTGKSSGLAGWMSGGMSTKGGTKSLKDDKKLDVAAGSQHGASEQGLCIVM